MSKTLIYVAILALLAGSIYFFIIKKDESPYGAKEAGFTIKDTASVYKIFLASTGNESITAERKNGVWMLDANTKALPSMVDLILSTVHNQEALYPVTKNAYDMSVKIWQRMGVKVMLYDKDNKVISVFYVGGPSTNEAGTDMMIDGAKTPYVVQTPGFSGDLHARYSTRRSDWRDRTVFNVPAEQLKSVSVQYTEHPINSYIYTKDKDKITVTGDPSVTTGMGGLNETRAKAYSTYFANVNCEGFLNGMDGMDTVIKTTVKMSTIDVETVSGTKEHADIYWMPLNKRSKNKMRGDDVVPDAYDADRMYAVINGNKDTVMIQDAYLLQAHAQVI